MTSEIEHNSPFLSTMAFSERTGLSREVMKRNEDGSIDVSAYDFTDAVVVINCASNFDGRKLLNIKEVVKAIHKAGGILIIDAAQAMAHSADIIRGIEVDDVNKDSYLLSAEGKEHRYTRFEAGLQAWGEIVGLGAALDWLEKLPKSAWKNLDKNTNELYDFLTNSEKIHLVNHVPNPTMSFYVDGLDSHLLGSALSREDIMARTGYFCAQLR